MTYQDKVESIAKFLYDETNRCATSLTHHISFARINGLYGVDMNDEELQGDVYGEVGENYVDMITNIDIDTVAKEIVIMLYEKQIDKVYSYTLENYKDFCRNALQAPPIEDFEEGKIDECEWYKNNMIHIKVGNHDIALDYCADNVNEVEWALNEMYDAEHDGDPTTGNTVGSEYPNATWKDILKVAVLMIFERNDYNYKGAIKTIHKFFDDKHFREALMFAAKGYDELNHHFKVNFLKVETNELHKIFDEQARYEALKSILCSDLQIEELYDKEGRCADKVMLTDYSIRPTGDFVGWHYGVDWDKESEDNQYYIQEYIKEMFGND